MLLNHASRTPRVWDDAIPSLCPQCRTPLIPRRGRVLIWHWAHRHANTTATAGGCSERETQWHLLWKSVYHDFQGWEVEAPIVIGSHVYRLDAFHRRDRKVREFVHSLSDTYVAKHLALSESSLDVLWIFDGSEFAAERRRTIRNGGIKHLLKPKARMLHAQVGGLVHFEGALWREWKFDCWYPVDSGVLLGLAATFDRKLSEVESETVSR